jgi:hypothetical protein
MRGLTLSIVANAPCKLIRLNAAVSGKVSGAMDRNTKATLHRRNVPEADKMSTEGRIEDLVRAFKILPKETQREYSIKVGGTEYGPH